ncbi:hypothetical protein JG687_00015895 [Phytophthora cactorum]|uniref:Uncharacterized protein n=1 Tax=Phytophthora cactorum TaxID=29920 RepID=A0A8T1TXI0_9STRA|nr:hypothetical protein JG687_00015895 [Phytophthora cactorum]
MVEWLKVPEHFNLIVGKTTSDRADGFGGAQTKLSRFGKVAGYVYASCITTFNQGEPDTASTRLKWDARTCQKRWTSYFITYKTTKQRLDNENFCAQLVY